VICPELSDSGFVAFLCHLEQDRGNHARTRNQRLADRPALPYGYIARRAPDMLATCQQVAAFPVKRAAPPETLFLERDEVEDLLRHLSRDGPLALRDCALILFLYNTGAPAQEVAGLRAEHLGEYPLARLYGKGGKWRTCPLWQQTARLLTAQLDPAGPARPAHQCSPPTATPHPLRHLQDHPPARLPCRRPAMPAATAGSAPAYPQVACDLVDPVSPGEPPGGLEPQPLAPLNPGQPKMGRTVCVFEWMAPCAGCSETARGTPDLTRMIAEVGGFPVVASSTRPKRLVYPAARGLVAISDLTMPTMRSVLSVESGK
jgi:hypothetical protein